MKKSCLAVMMLVLGMATGGCDTGNDVGDNLEDAGDEIQDAAEDVGDEIEDAADEADG